MIDAELTGDLVYKFRNIDGKSNSLEKFKHSFPLIKQKI